jgi:hypothetical protein
VAALSVAVLVRIFTGCDARNPQPLTADKRAMKNMKVVLRK